MLFDFSVWADKIVVVAKIRNTQHFKTAKFLTFNSFRDVLNFENLANRPYSIKRPSQP